MLDRKDKSPLVLAHEKASGFCNSGVVSSITSDCTMVLESLQGEVQNKFQPKKQAALQLSSLRFPVRLGYYPMYPPSILSYL